MAALRQDPDVILVGEIRDLNTIRTAIVAAETGHLVFTTVHAGDCVGTIERLVAVFPADEQDGVRRQLAMVLRAVVAQHLLVADGTARGPGPPKATATRPATSLHGGVGSSPSEVLMVNPAVANLIATGRSNQIYSAMEAGGAAGMQTLEQDLAQLWTAGRISEATAVAMARNPGILRDRVARIRGKTGRRQFQRKGTVMSKSLSTTIADEPLDMDQVRIDPAWALKIPAALALRRQVLPFASVSGSGVRGLPGPAGSLGPGGGRAERAVADLPADRRSSLAATGLEPHFRQRCSGGVASPAVRRNGDAAAAGDPRQRRGHGPVRRADARGHGAPGVGHPYRSGGEARAGAAPRRRSAGAVPHLAHAGPERA